MKEDELKVSDKIRSIKSKVSKGLVVGALAASLMLSSGCAPVLQNQREVAQAFTEEELLEFGRVIPQGTSLLYVILSEETGEVQTISHATVTYVQYVNGIWQYGATAHNATFFDSFQNDDKDAMLFPASIVGIDTDENRLVVDGNIDLNNQIGRPKVGTHFGDFGVVSQDFILSEGANMFVGVPEIGPAEMLATISERGVESFAIEIVGVATSLVREANSGSEREQNIIIYEIVDERFLQEIGERSVRGISGAPIIQNGRLIGAHKGSDGERNIAIWAAEMIREHILQRELNKQKTIDNAQVSDLER